MYKHIKSELALVKRTPASKLVSLLVLSVVPIMAVMFFVTPNNTAKALAPSTINFQARLLNSAGAIVPDGNYNVEFKLYNASVLQSGQTQSGQGTCGTDVNCLWVETRTGSNAVRVQNGYLTVNLGSVNPFPSNFNWGQQLWLTMNVGGVGATPTWDGEMSPRIQLTATPYAFDAGELSTLNTVTGYSSVLQFTPPASGNDVITLPDATGTVCLVGNSSCGFASSSGSGSYIQNSSLLQTSASFNIQSASGNVAGVLEANGADILDLKNSSGITVGSFNSTGSVVIKPSTVSQTAVQVEGASSTVLDVDTANGRVGVNTSTPAYALDVNGDINSNTAVRVGGVAVCTVSDCVPASGSNNYIQNSTTTQANANFSIRSAQNNAVTAVLQGYGDSTNGYTQTSDILDLQSWNGTSTATLDSFGANGNLTVDANSTVSVTSPTAFLVQSASSVATLTVDTGNNRVDIGTIGTPTGQLYISGSVPTAATGSVSTGANPFSVYVQGNYAYVANYGSNALGIYNVSNPAAPVSVGSVSTGSFPNSVYVKGNYAYVTNEGSNTLGIYNVSNPAAPVSVGSVSTGASSYPYSVYVQGNYAYIANYGSSTLSIYNVGGTYSQSLQAGGLQTNTLDVVSNTSLGGDTNITGGLAVGGNTELQGNLGVSGQAAFQNLTNSTTAFQIQNATGTSLLTGDTTNNRIDIGTNGTPTGQLYVSGNVPVYIGQNSDANLSEPYSVFVSGHYEYVASEGNSKLLAYDTSSGTPLYIGENSDSNLLYPYSVFVSGHYAYVASNGNGKLVVYDVSTGIPVYVGENSDNHLGRPQSVYVSGRYAYVASNVNNKLVVYDISSGTPVYVGENSDSNLSNPISVYISGHYAYVVSSTNGKLVVYDISSGTPVYVGENSDSNLSSPQSVYISGSYAYVTSYYTSKLVVYNISSGTPVYVGENSDSNLNEPVSAYVSGRYAYVASNGNAKLAVYDISSGTPVYVGENSDSNLSHPQSVYVSGRYAYVASYGSNKVVTYDLGGTYTQTLQAGSTETSSLQVDTNAAILGDTNIQGGLSVGGSANLQENVGVAGQLLLANTANSTTAFQIQDASGNVILTANTVNDSIIIGSGSNTVTLNSSNGITLSGTARHTKQIVLVPEYAGAVLDSAGALNDVGTMTSGYDSTQKENYYQWTTSASTNQTYDIVVQIPIPSDFSAWASSAPLTVDVNTSDTTNGTVVGTLLDTSGAAVTNWNTCALTPTVTGWIRSGAGAIDGATCDITSGTWTPGSPSTLMLQLQAPTNGTTEVGDIILTYLTAY